MSFLETYITLLIHFLKSCPRALTEHHTMKVYWGVEV
jgi:hypothetical protein